MNNDILMAALLYGTSTVLTTLFGQNASVSQEKVLAESRRMYPGQRPCDSRPSHMRTLFVSEEALTGKRKTGFAIVKIDGKPYIAERNAPAHHIDPVRLSLMDVPGDKIEFIKSYCDGAHAQEDDSLYCGALANSYAHMSAKNDLFRNRCSNVSNKNKIAFSQ